MSPCEVIDLGVMSYAEAWTLQNRLAELRATEGIDRLLFVEHPHTFTLGTSGEMSNVLWDEAERARRGVELFRTDRGGDVTYHGPGQVVGYPIIGLSKPSGAGVLRASVTAYVRGLEETILRALADYGVSGKRIAGLTGVWVDTPRGEAKIAAIGVRINVKAVTKHGFAFNVAPDLTYFEGIIPCGIADKGVTSLAALLGNPPPAMSDVRARLARHFGAVFGFDMRVGALPQVSDALP